MTKVTQAGGSHEIPEPLDVTEVNSAAILAAVDGLEALITTLNGLVATSANQATIIAALSAIAGYVDGIEALLTTLNGKDFATETTLALVKAKTDNLDVALSTRNLEATQLLIKAKTDNLDVALSTKATEATLIQVRDYLDTVETKLALLGLESTQALIAGYVDGIETLLTTLNSKDFSTEATLALVKQNLDDIKVYSDGIETLLTTLNAKDFATQTTLALVKTNLDDVKTYLDGVEGLLTTLNAKDFATQTTLATLGLEATQQLIKTSVQLLDDAIATLGTDTYTEGTSKGITIGAVRRDSDSSLANTTNEFAPLQVDPLGRLKVSDLGRTVLFKGRACSFMTPGRAGILGQKILSLHNATGSAIKVSIRKVTVDLFCTVVKAITVAPPIIRLWKVTVLPTNGTALAKTKIGGTTTSNASVTVLGDASVDGVGSVTTLTATLPTGTFVAQQTAARFITAAGYEVADVCELLPNSEIELNALEGVVVFLDYILATQNPITDMWMAAIEWEELTP